MSQQELAQTVLRKHESMVSGRVNWESYWDDIAKFFVPRKDTVYGNSTPGERKANRLFDTVGIQAVDDLAAALHSLFTNSKLIWFGLSTGDPELDSKDAIQKWLHKTTLKLLSIINNSNFQVEILETYTDLVSPGTTSLRIEADDEDIVRYYSEVIYNVYIDENKKGDVDTVSRVYEWNKRQIMQEFSEDMHKRSRETMLRDMGDDPNKMFEIVHLVQPRTARRATRGCG